MKHDVVVGRVVARAAVLVALVAGLAVANAHANGLPDSLGDSRDPSAAVSDMYIFRSWNNPDRVVLIMNVFPGQVAAGGPAFFPFDDAAVYRLHVDNNMDGVAADVVYEVRFKTELREPTGVKWPTAYVGHPNLVAPELRGITALDGSGSEGIVARQTYTVTETRGGRRKALFYGRRLVAVPANAGPLVIPDYEALAAQGVYADSGSGIRVFAGQRAESVYGDTGALFDGLGFQRQPPFLTDAEDANHQANAFGVNRFRGLNVNSIVLEVPIARLTADGRGADDAAVPFIGAYASTGRSPITLLGLAPSQAAQLQSVADSILGGARFVQVSRMGNPSMRALMFDMATKDKYNRTLPARDAQYQEGIKHPVFSLVMLSQMLGFPVPPAPRTDLLQILYKYPGQPLAGDTCGDPCADLLHLNLRVPPTAPAAQNRLGALLSPDPSGLPNGRRPSDDVFDITLRAFGGPAAAFQHFGDGINCAADVPGAGVSDGPGYGSIPGNRLDVTVGGMASEFPFLATPHAAHN